MTHLISPNRVVIKSKLKVVSQKKSDLTYNESMLFLVKLYLGLLVVICNRKLRKLLIRKRNWIKCTWSELSKTPQKWEVPEPLPLAAAWIRWLLLLHTVTLSLALWTLSLHPSDQCPRPHASSRETPPPFTAKSLVQCPTKPWPKQELLKMA